MSICNYVTCCMSHCTCHMSYVKCLCWSLGHAEQLLFSCLYSKVSICNYYVTCHILHVTCNMPHCACHMSYIKCLCWFLWHAEQLLFWSLCSKVSICNYVTCCMSHVACHMSHVLCQMLMLILGTCLCSNVAVYGWKRQWLFFDTVFDTVFDTRTLSCEWSNHRAGSQLKITL